MFDSVLGDGDRTELLCLYLEQITATRLL